MKLYFAYGANLNIAAMAYRCPDADPVSRFYLPGYRLTFSGVATIVPDDTAHVAGALWHISTQDEANLDIFEGFPHLYRKQNFSINGREFMAYVMNHSDQYSPSSSYVATIRQGYRDWRLDTKFLDRAINSFNYNNNHRTQYSRRAVHSSTNIPQ
jgi:gamma-glutamylcyclotransferase (GGCT)/AIG2-like uncharacterized protein YtfP